VDDPHGGDVPALAGPARISVIVVNYNAGGLLADCVAAVLGSDIPLELIVSDNGSIDGSLELVSSRYGADSRLTLVENGANLGFAAANNRVLDRAQASYLLFLNPDCMVQRDTLRRLVSFMEATPDAGMAGCVIRNPDGSEQKASRRRIPDAGVGLTHFLRLERFSRRLRHKRLNLVDEPLPPHPIQVEAISGSFMLVRRTALEEIGPLDEGYFLHCEDLDWFARFALSDWKIYFVPELEVVHDQGACSKGHPIRIEWHKHRGMVRFFRKFQARRYLGPFRLLVVAGIWSHFAMLALMEGVRRLPERMGRAFGRTRVW
jgi:GT2 family glycosyltransferase